MYKLITITFMVILLCGCSTTQSIKVSDANATVIDYGADRRGAYILKTDEGKYIVVSEPSPDVAQEIISSLGLSAKTIGEFVDPNLQAKYAIKILDLAGRSQTLQVLRESLFRLSEMGASSDITVEDRVTLYIKVLDTVRLIAATEFANSEASQEVIDTTLEKFLLDTGENTLEDPTLGDPNES